MCSLSQQITQLRKKPIRWHVSGLFVFLYIFKYPGCVLFFTLVYKSFPLHFFSCAVSVINRITGGQLANFISLLALPSTVRSLDYTMEERPLPQPVSPFSLPHPPVCLSLPLLLSRAEQKAVCQQPVPRRIRNLLVRAVFLGLNSQFLSSFQLQLEERVDRKAKQILLLVCLKLGRGGQFG